MTHSSGYSQAILVVVEPPMRSYGWATGYARFIYGTEYTQQCPLATVMATAMAERLRYLKGLQGGAMGNAMKGGGRRPIAGVLMVVPYYVRAYANFLPRVYARTRRADRGR